MRQMLITAGLLGSTGVGLGAFGAHGLEDALAALGLPEDSIPKRLENFATGVRYQLHAAVAVAVVAALAGRAVCLRGAAVAAWLFTGGALVFSGLLYALALLGPEWRWLGAIVPIGGLSLIGGWVALAVEAILRPAPEVKASVGDNDLRAEVIRLEEVITHQQQMVQDLNESVTAARDEADASGRRVHSMELTVKRLVDLQQAAEDLPDERPPHY